MYWEKTSLQAIRVSQDGIITSRVGWLVRINEITKLPTYPTYLCDVKVDFSDVTRTTPSFLVHGNLGVAMWKEKRERLPIPAWVSTLSTMWSQFMETVASTDDEVCFLCGDNGDSAVYSCALCRLASHEQCVQQSLHVPEWADRIFGMKTQWSHHHVLSSIRIARGSVCGFCMSALD